MLLRLERKCRYWLSGDIGNESRLLISSIARGYFWSWLLDHLGSCEGGDEEREHAETEECGEDIDEGLFH